MFSQDLRLKDFFKERKERKKRVALKFCSVFPEKNGSNKWSNENKLICVKTTIESNMHHLVPVESLLQVFIFFVRSYQIWTEIWLAHFWAPVKKKVEMGGNEVVSICLKSTSIEPKERVDGFNYSLICIFFKMWEVIINFFLGSEIIRERENGSLVLIPNEPWSWNCIPYKHYFEEGTLKNKWSSKDSDF